MKINIPETNKPRMIILGAGFARLVRARKINPNGYQIVLLDRHNYHAFQSLLYQATAGGLEL